MDVVFFLLFCGEEFMDLQQQILDVLLEIEYIEKRVSEFDEFRTGVVTKLCSN